MTKRFAFAALTTLSLLAVPYARATTVVLPSDQQLVEKTPLIIRGTVLETLAVEHVERRRSDALKHLVEPNDLRPVRFGI